ncbi:uncharacterized protein ARMOST_13748 [Armillaria ostoyae]|uniref:DUF6535 domain-containing protein n=1 Tax=Armillaria ostoyae TaxID=47428 RepID=A0A284RNK9_ARMOS|nr:uncharacterized protein ARMOST_13748 [Armillaria ostoyae]
MSDQHPLVDEVSRHSSEGISDVQDRPEGSPQNNDAKLRQNNEKEPEKMKTGKEHVNADIELSSPGIQEEAGVEGDRGAKKSRPDAGLKTGNDPFNYEDKYPEDNIYEETAPNARVWRTYVDESTNYDARMVGESRDSVDVLLVFAGLFSAVVTTLVSQTSQSLQADYTQVSAALLFEIVLIQRAIANGSSLDNVPVSSLNPYTAFTPATTDVWVNGLWFTSLSLSLATALVAVLVKQWLHHYLALPSGTPRERSHVRQYRYGGFQRWHVLVIIGLLPVLMHLALGIFFVGLVVFLVPLRPGLSWVIGIGTVAAYVTYLITIFLPILYPQCPYRTPLSDLVYFPYRYITQDMFLQHIRPLFGEKTVYESNGISSLDDLEREMVQERSGILSAEALHWLFSSSSNPTVHSIVIQSIGGLPLSAKDTVKKLFGEATDICFAQSDLLWDSMQIQLHSSKPKPGMEPKVERLLRFELFIPYWLHAGRGRFYVDVADGDLELAATVQSNDSLQRSQYEPSNTPTPAAFFEKVASSSESKLSPVVWLKLMRMAKDDGAFAPIDVGSLDPFPVDLCSRVLPWIMSPFKDTSPCLYFENAAPAYFNDELTANLLNMLSAFDILTDKTSFPSTFKLALAFIRYLLHRVSLSSFDVDIQRAILDARFVLRSYAFKNLPDEQIAALANLLEQIVHSPVFKLGSEWTGVQISLLDVYSGMVGVWTPGRSARHNFWPALQPLVKTMINQYDALYSADDVDDLTPAPFDTV